MLLRIVVGTEVQFRWEGCCAHQQWRDEDVLFLMKPSCNAWGSYKCERRFVWLTFRRIHNSFWLLMIQDNKMRLWHASSDFPPRETTDVSPMFRLTRIEASTTKVNSYIFFLVRQLTYHRYSDSLGMKHHRSILIPIFSSSRDDWPITDIPTNSLWILFNSDRFAGSCLYHDWPGLARHESPPIRASSDPLVGSCLSFGTSWSWAPRCPPFIWKNR